MPWQPANPVLSELSHIVKLAEPAKRFAGEGASSVENPQGFELAEWVQRHARGLAWEVYKRLFLDALKLYRALKAALEFHESACTFRLVVGPNQGGKSAAVEAETARILRGKHPRFQAKNGLMLCVGRDDDHLSQVMWKELTQPGQFDLVLDEITGLPRAVRPDKKREGIDPIDLERKAQWFPAPPFLPQEEWDYKGGISWADAGAQVPRICRIRSTNWEALWHPSGGNPRRGIKVNRVWVDEEIRKQWFYELLPRIMRRAGVIDWSATSQSENEELVQMIHRAEAGEPSICMVKMMVEDNPYIPAHMREIIAQTMYEMDEEQYASRVKGDPMMDQRQVYPQHLLRTIQVQGFDG